MVSDLKTFAYKGCRISAQKDDFRQILAYKLDFFLVLVPLFASVERCFVSHIQDFFKDNYFIYIICLY